MTTAIDPSADPFGLMRPEARMNPYPVYARLREEAPAHFSAGWGGWLVTRHADVQALLRDDRLSAERAHLFASRFPEPQRSLSLPLIPHFAGWTLFMDPPVHTRMRALITKAFSPKLIEDLRPRVQAIVDELLDAAGARGTMDIVRDLAAPLPVTVIGAMLGMPRDDFAKLKDWSVALAAWLGGRSKSMELVEQGRRCVAEMEDYFRAALADRRASPGDDLLSSLLTAEEQGSILNDQEILSTCSMLLFAGHETTTNLIGNGTYHLLKQPEAFRALRDDPSLIVTAVEELLRYESPVQRVTRITREEIQVAGVTIPKSQGVFLVMGAANRDPEAFEDPDRLDIRRTNNRHLGFGLGPHYCAGAALGRLEGQVAIRSLLQRFPEVRLSGGEPEWFDQFILRGFPSLPVELSAAA